MSNEEESERPMDEDPEASGENQDNGDEDAGDVENEEPKDEGEEEAGEEEEKQDDAPEPKMALRVEIQNEPEGSPRKDNKPSAIVEPPPLSVIKEENMDIKEEENMDPKVQADLDYMRDTAPTTKLENILLDALKRKDTHIERLTSEVTKLKALSAYNIFVQDRFAKLAKENEAALKSSDSHAQLKRVPPANLVASTGNLWKDLAPEDKVNYEERAKTDRKRYEEQMAQYQPPDKQANRKRNKTGYNMFFSAHVLRLKQSEMGVPSERGSVARLVGTAWKVGAPVLKNVFLSLIKTYNYSFRSFLHNRALMLRKSSTMREKPISTTA
jgi:hypothetical protein